MKNAIFLTSKLDLYDKTEDGVRIPKIFSNKNGILDNLKKYIKKYDNFLLVASDENNIENTDTYAKVNIESFDMTLPFKNYKILDIRTEKNAKELIEEADFIYLVGGHVPTQNKFFNNIKLKELIKNAKGVILGTSAGSMNSAEIVYAAPELEGESTDPNFKRELPGIGLTNINILPHYNNLKEYKLDNKDFINEIIIPDSYERKIYAITDGSYFLINDNKLELYGEAYVIENGKITEYR